jgi:nicotinamide N-methyltransferase
MLSSLATSHRHYYRYSTCPCSCICTKDFEKHVSILTAPLYHQSSCTIGSIVHNGTTDVRQGHHLWNAGRITSTYLEEHAAKLVKKKTVLELGAGAGLPSLVCALNGARRVVVTDYPDAELIENLQYNIDHCELLPAPRQIAAEGYLWGAPIQDIVQHLPEMDEAFDVLILADLLFNHSEHAKLIETVRLTLKRSPDSKAYVFFTPYRPWLLEKDLAFFDLARAAGFAVEKTFEKVMDKVMFEEDPGVSFVTMRGSEQGS